MLELDDTRPRKVLLEALDVLDTRAAPSIDRLVVVADYEGNAAVTGEKPQPGILDCVRVLELVDEQVLESPLVVGEEVGVVTQQLMGAQQELRKIDEPATLADFFVGGVE